MIMVDVLGIERSEARSCWKTFLIRGQRNQMNCLQQQGAATRVLHQLSREVPSDHDRRVLGDERSEASVMFAPFN